MFILSCVKSYQALIFLVLFELSLQTTAANSSEAFQQAISDSTASQLVRDCCLTSDEEGVWLLRQPIGIFFDISDYLSNSESQDLRLFLMKIRHDGVKIDIVYNLSSDWPSRYGSLIYVALVPTVRTDLTKETTERLTLAFEAMSDLNKNKTFQSELDDIYAGDIDVGYNGSAVNRQIVLSDWGGFTRVGRRYWSTMLADIW